MIRNAAAAILAAFFSLAGCISADNGATVTFTLDYPPAPAVDKSYPVVDKLREQVVK